MGKKESAPRYCSVTSCRYPHARFPTWRHQLKMHVRQALASRDALKQLSKVGTNVLHLGVPLTPGFVHNGAALTRGGHLKKQTVEVPSAGCGRRWSGSQTPQCERMALVRYLCLNLVCGWHVTICAMPPNIFFPYLNAGWRLRLMRGGETYPRGGGGQPGNPWVWVVGDE